jgi:hypothetical protein
MVVRRTAYLAHDLTRLAILFFIAAFELTIS